MNFSKLMLAASSILAAFTVATSAEAKPRTPLYPREQRVSALAVGDDVPFSELVQRRDGSIKPAVFSADPQAIDSSGVMVFEIFSESAKGRAARWRCVAVNDVAECLGVPVKVSYQKGDERMIMRVSMSHRDGPLGQALLAEHQSHRGTLVASAE